MNDPAKADPLSRARCLGAAAEDAADEIERRRRLVPEVLDAIHRLRLTRMFVPRSVGGDEVAPADAVAAIEEISRRDLSVAWNVFVANAAALIAPYLPPETAREVFGAPRALVAWGPPGDHAFEAAPGGFRVSGRWGFASGCRHATWMGAHGHVAEPDGGKRRDARGEPIVLTVLFPADKAILLNDWNAIGMRGTGSESYRVDGLFVPESHSGLRDDPSLRREPGPLYAFTIRVSTRRGSPRWRSARRGRCSTHSSPSPFARRRAACGASPTDRPRRPQWRGRKRSSVRPAPGSGTF